MIVLNNFWNKEYLPKSRKNGWKRCWVMTLKSSKKGKQFFFADALSRKDEDVEALHCAIYIIQDEWKNNEEVWTLIQNFRRALKIFKNLRQGQEGFFLGWP